MIRNDSEYKQTCKRLAAGEAHIRQQRDTLERLRLSADEIKRVLDPLRCFHEHLRAETASYERHKRREVEKT